MSRFDVEPEDMTRASVIDEKLNALLSGLDPVAEDELAFELAWMIDQVDNAFPLPVLPKQVEDTHLARMMEVSGEVPLAAIAPIASVRASVLGRLRAGLSHRVAAATLALTAAFGGAAYAGVLPAPVQEAVSNAAAIVGLELPNPTDDVADQDDRRPEELGDDSRSPDDAEGTGPGGPRSGSGADSAEDGRESKRDDPDQEGNNDGHAADGPASDDDSDQDDSDSGNEPDGNEPGVEPDGNEPDGDEPDGDEPDGDEPDGDEPDGDEPDGDEPDGDEPDGDEPDGDEPDGDEPDNGDELGNGDSSSAVEVDSGTEDGADG